MLFVSNQSVRRTRGILELKYTLIIQEETSKENHNRVVCLSVHDKDTVTFLLKFLRVRKHISIFKLSTRINVLRVSFFKPFEKLAVRASPDLKCAAVASCFKPDKAFLLVV